VPQVLQRPVFARSGEWAPSFLIADNSDALGAGDAFTAALAIELLLGTPLELIAEKANDYARHFASTRGGFGFVP